MKFLLQSNCDDMKIEMVIVEELLGRTKFTNSFTKMSLEEIKDSREELADFIPVGTIQFVTQWLNEYHGIERINPIEVPKFLRTAKFLKRDYRISPFDEIPKEGRYFVKDVSELKKFSFSGNVEYLFEEYKGDIDETHIFQISSLEDIISEYRIYILDGRIENVCNYNGDPEVFPDMRIIDEANSLYSLRPDYPKSLTIDVMVTPKGTSIIEIHPFIACGLYNTLWGTNLLQAYRDGIEYVKRFNTPLEA